ncbi:MAG: prephenate dehydrogenase, partial [Candidatus Omnitrophica bacterium]|nr:prephenate dehydrogenase [Candidatus Omnitrophota bacterium]
MKMRKVVVIGMGLIGGSVGKALLKKGLADEVVGVCRRQSSLDRAIKEGVLTDGYVNNYEKAAFGAEMIVIATPVATVKDVLKDLSEVIKDQKVIVTDVGSAKKEIVDYAAGVNGTFLFVGGHPLAGSEKSGVENSTASLFEGSLCVLTDDEGVTDKDALCEVTGMWEAMGARVQVQTPEEHDGMIAFTSHLPHIVAYALVGALPPLPLSMFATGFKDTTRIASSDASLWSEIFLSNRKNLLVAIRRFKDVISDIEKDIRENNKVLLEEKLRDFKKTRD